MSPISILTLVIVGVTIMVGFILGRALVTQKMWFIAIEPVRSKSPILFWWCFFCSGFAFAGGLLAAAILLLASTS